MSLVAGVTNLATDVTQVDHDYGYGLVALGAVAFITGAIWYFVHSSHSDGDLKTLARAERASVDGRLSAPTSLSSAFLNRRGFRDSLHNP